MPSAARKLLKDLEKRSAHCLQAGQQNGDAPACG